MIHRKLAVCVTKGQIPSNVPCIYAAFTTEIFFKDCSAPSQIHLLASVTLMPKEVTELTHQNTWFSARAFLDPLHLIYTQMPVLAHSLPNSKVCYNTGISLNKKKICKMQHVGNDFTQHNLKRTVCMYGLSGSIILAQEIQWQILQTKPANSFSAKYNLNN